MGLGRPMFSMRTMVSPSKLPKTWKGKELATQVNLMNVIIGQFECKHHANPTLVVHNKSKRHNAKISKQTKRLKADQVNHLQRLFPQGGLLGVVGLPQTEEQRIHFVAQDLLVQF